MLVLRTLDAEFSIAHPDLIPAIAARLNDRLTARIGWSRIEAARREFEEWTTSQLRELLGQSAPPDALARLGSAGLVEVKMSPPPLTPRHAWKLPWEFFIITATKPFRTRSQPLVVFRYLKHIEASNSTVPVEAVPHRLLVVKSNPGFLGDLYADVTFDREEENVRLDLGLNTGSDAHNLTRELLQSEIQDRSPNVIHFAAVDAVQAIKHLQPKRRFFDDVPEGVMIAGKEQPVSLEADGLAAVTCSSSQTLPLLIGCNFNHSGADLAPSMVARGASASLAILYDTDDTLAENFFHNFYSAWRLSMWRLLDAFRVARAEMTALEINSFRGNGLILWSGRSLIDQERTDRQRDQRKANPALPPPELRRLFETERQEPARPREGEKPLRVVCEPHDELNYSLLHNNRSPFERFYLRKAASRGSLKGVRIEVALHAGDERLAYQATADMTTSLWLLDREVRIPLTSALARSARESIYTSLFVEVSLEDKSVFRSTFRVSLLPIDQWQDDDNNRQWLPSFVLPRDPAVTDIVNSAQSYLVALADSIDAVFDGYQSVNPDLVDAQVQAIWWALNYSRPLSYINPPPTFSTEAQRLRSPSQVLKAGRGTCIDLALLIASCLESVDIYPVLFLLRGHAFLGYFRDERAHARMSEECVARFARDDADAWMLGQEFYPEVLKMVQDGDLVPLETVLLTQRRGFSEAIEEGAANLRNLDDFEYLIDIRLARENGVTPLPLTEV